MQLLFKCNPFFHRIIR